MSCNSSPMRYQAAVSPRSLAALSPITRWVCPLALLILIFASAAQAQDRTTLALRLRELVKQQRWQDAVVVADQYVDLVRRELGARHPDFVGGQKLLAAILGNIGLQNFAQGRYRDAEIAFRRSIDINTAILGPDHQYVLNTRNNLAQSLKAQGQFEEAERIHRQLLVERERSLPPDHPDVTAALNNLSAVLHSMGRFRESEAFARRALANNEKLNAQQQVALSAMNLANALYGQARFAEAETMFRRALEIREGALGTEHPEVAQALSNLAACLDSQGRYEEAAALHRRALAIREKVLPPGHPDIGYSLNNLGSTLFELQRYSEAEQFARRALALREAALTSNHPEVGVTLNNLAQALVKQGRLSEAETTQRRANAIFQRVLPASHPKRAEDLNNLAYILSLQGRFSEGEPLLQQAHAIREKALPPNHPDLARSFSNLAATLEATRKYPEAYAAARRSAEILAARAFIEGAQSTNSIYAAPPRLMFARASVLAWDAAQQDPSRRTTLTDEAFTWAQWAERSSAAAALAQTTARFAARGDALSKLVRQLQDLSLHRQTLDRQLLAALSRLHQDEKTLSELRGDLARTDDGVKQISSAIASQFPQYASLANPQPLLLAQVRPLLKPDEVLLVYLLGEKHGVAWLITGDALRWELIPLPANVIAEQVHVLRCGLDREGEWEWSAEKRRWIGRTSTCAALQPQGLSPLDPLPFDLAAAHELFQVLLGPFANAIKGKRILAVLPPSLSSLPLHVLVTEKPSVMHLSNLSDYRQVPWMVKSNPITVLPSVSSLKALRGQGGLARAPKPYLGFGNPLLDGDPYDSNDKRLALEARQKQHCAPPGSHPPQPTLDRAAFPLRRPVAKLDAVRQQPPLPETADELCEVARILGVPDTEIYLGARATENTVKALSTNGALANARIIHFATHGLLPTESRLLANDLAEPALLLSPPTQSDVGHQTDPDDGLLTASEIAELRLNADWVILSACNTAGGDRADVDPLSGLARAFFYAGARALLVSHWYVVSRSAVQLTTNAFTELKAGRTYSEALRRSMLALILDGAERQAHPSYWAPFVLVGADRQ